MPGKCAHRPFTRARPSRRATPLPARLWKRRHGKRTTSAWSSARIRELDGHPSILTPLWYAGSLAIGTASGFLGDRWNLAFLAETERQVGEHLEGHLGRLPASDARTRELIAAMRDDEEKHRRSALELGAAEMPAPARLAMRLMAKVMTTVAYRL